MTITCGHFNFIVRDKVKRAGTTDPEALAATLTGRTDCAGGNSQKTNNRASGLVEEAIALAKSGTEVGVAWVFSRIEDRRHKAGERRSRLSSKVRKAIHSAIEQHGEEKILELLKSLEEGT